MDNKGRNYYKVLKVLYERNELTKLDISKITGLSIPTVTKNTDELIEDGFIKNSGVASSSGGRKPALLIINEDARYSLGADISPDRVRIILTNIKLRIIERTEFKLDKSISCDDIMKKIREEIENMIEKNKIDWNKILGMGISLHGVINRNRMILSVAPNMNLSEIDFRKYRENFPFDIYIENEANCGVVAEKFFLNEEDDKDIVYLSINEGLGSGTIINNKVFKGSHERAVEFGHMKMGNQGRVCGCGSKDCWETYCSEKALLNDFILSTGERLNNVGQIFQLYKDGDKRTKDIILNYMDSLADGIRNAILIMDPDVVIIGGHVARFKEIVDDYIIQKVYEDCKLYSQKDTQIIFSFLYEDASIIGAALIPLNKYYLP